MLGISYTLWILIGLAVAVGLAAFTLGRFIKFGPTRILFLAPAALFFAVFVIYPIGGSAWISLHEAYDNRYVCADGRALGTLSKGQTCRRVLDMEWNGLGHYQDLFLGPWDEDKQQYRGLAKDTQRLAKSLNTLSTWTLSGFQNLPARTYNLTFGNLGFEPFAIREAKRPSYPRLSPMWESVINNTLWLLMFQVAIPIGLALAVLLNQSTLVNRLVKPLFFFPFVIAPAVIAFLFQFFYNPDAGPLVGFYQWMGWGKNGILGTSGWSNIGIIFAAWYPQIAYCIIIYLAGLTAINPELIEAGSLDGAKGFRLFRLIILPQLWPATFICVVVTTIGALRSFDLVQVMTVGQRRSEVMARYMFDLGFGEGGGNYGKSAAVSMVLFAFMLIFIAFFVTRMVRQTED